MTFNYQQHTTSQATPQRGLFTPLQETDDAKSELPKENRFLIDTNSSYLNLQL